MARVSIRYPAEPVGVSGVVGERLAFILEKVNFHSFSFTKYKVKAIAGKIKAGKGKKGYPLNSPK